MTDTIRAQLLLSVISKPRVAKLVQITLCSAQAFEDEYFFVKMFVAISQLSAVKIFHFPGGALTFAIKLFTEATVI